ncbi:MAG: glycerate dehydrogenase [Spirochaetae bacterium HGW-Spirochaetae-8]|nr:MAG: glycerate dehydrogenase [Spirochaetae bacterium HGW-Spirochaetae-8]
MFKEKIVVLDGFTLNPGDLDWSGFEKLGEFTVYDRTAADEIVKRIGNASVVITNKTPLDAAVLEACPSIRYIGVLATGFNVVDVRTATSKGIVVTNIPTYGTTAVAQFAFALLLELCHHVGDHARAVREGRWASCADFCFWDTPLVELAGKTFGIIGMGRIGYATAVIAQAFGMKVLAYDAYRNPAWESDTLRYTSFEDLLAQSDVISLHCPLTDETKGIVNKKSIALMKDGVLLLNTSRGPLIVEQDLADALVSGKVAGAAMDVVAQEPPKADNVLFSAPNCLVTPHIAWAPKESRARLMRIAVENLESFLAGTNKNRVGV